MDIGYYICFSRYICMDTNMKVTSANANSKSVHVACIFIFVLWCNVRQHSLDNNVDSQLLSNNRYLLRVVFVHLGRIKRCLIFYRARNEIIIRAGSVGAGLQRGGRGGGGLLHLAQCNTHWPPNIYIISTYIWNLTRGRAGKGSSRSLKFHNHAEGPF